MDKIYAGFAMRKEIEAMYYIFLNRQPENLMERFYLFNIKEEVVSSDAVIKFARKNGIEIRIKVC